MDVDKNKLITQNKELKDWLQIAREKLCLTKAPSTFKGLASSKYKEKPNTIKIDSAALAFNKQIFSEADLDNDSLLNLEEFKPLYIKVTPNSPMRLHDQSFVWEGMFRLFDLDNNS